MNAIISREKKKYPIPLCSNHKFEAEDKNERSTGLYRFEHLYEGCS